MTRTEKLKELREIAECAVDGYVPERLSGESRDWWRGLADGLAFALERDTRDLDQTLAQARDRKDGE